MLCTKLKDKYLLVGMTGFDTAVKDVDIAQTGVVSKNFSSPQMILDKRWVSEKTDVWSLGVFIHYMITGKLPF